MNRQFTNKQIEAYARHFKEDDAIFVNNNWERVIVRRRFEVTTENDEIDNPFLINRDVGVVEGFRISRQVTHPYRVTTTRDYSLQGGEKLIFLGKQPDLTFGKSYTAQKSEYSDRFYIVDDSDDKLVFYPSETPYQSQWGIIPTYKQVLVKQLEEAMGTLPVENMTVEEFEEESLNDELLELLGKKYLALEDRHMSIYNERRELEGEIARKESEMDKLDELMSDISKVIQSLEN